MKIKIAKVIRFPGREMFKPGDERKLGARLKKIKDKEELEQTMDSLLESGALIDEDKLPKVEPEDAGEDDAGDDEEGA